MEKKLRDPKPPKEEIKRATEKAHEKTAAARRRDKRRGNLKHYIMGGENDIIL